MKLHWGNSILIFFILFITLAVTFIVFSFNQNNDLVTEDYYEQGANYSDRIKVNQRSFIFQDSVEIKQDLQQVTVSISTGLLVQSTQFNIYFFKPSDKAEDYKVSFSSSSPMIISKDLLAHGRYEIQISWFANGDEYLLVKDLLVNKPY